MSFTKSLLHCLNKWSMLGCKVPQDQVFVMHCNFVMYFVYNSCLLSHQLLKFLEGE